MSIRKSNKIQKKIAGKVKVKKFVTTAKKNEVNKGIDAFEI